MNVITLGILGPCFGVDRAIKQAIDVHKKNGESNIYFSHPLVHNKLTNALVQEETGGKFLNGISEESLMGLDKVSIIMFSAHGHPLDEEKLVSKKNIAFIDCFCPLLKTKYLMIDNAIKTHDSFLLYIGKASHQETIATMANYPNLFFIDSSLPISNIKLPNIAGKNVFIFRQSTIIFYPFEELISAINKRNPISLTIEGPCRYLKERFEEIEKVKASAKSLFIVVGDISSSNANELLVECKTRHPRSNSLLINSKDELYDLDLSSFHEAYVVSSTSALKSNSLDIINYLKAL